MNEATYKKSFDLFLKKTDEKSVLMTFIRDHVSLNKEMHFLDIGGGDGSLAAWISKEVGTTLVVEPNPHFCEKLDQKGFKIVNKKWEDVDLDQRFDFILAAYVVTYFPPDQRHALVTKMYDRLAPGGKLLLLSVDAQEGSWREIHTFFYELMGQAHVSSDNALQKIAREFHALMETFQTHIIAASISEMLNILEFDFHKYAKAFSQYTPNLKTFLLPCTNSDGSITLEMIHRAYLITKH